MSQQQPGPLHLLGVRFTLTEPSRMNGASEGASNNLVGMFFVDCDSLRGPREIVLIAAQRMESVLTSLMAAVDKATRAYNEQNPLPDAPEEAGEEEEKPDLQA